MGYMFNDKASSKKEFYTQEKKEYIDNGFRVIRSCSKKDAFYFLLRDREGKHFIMVHLVNKHTGCYGSKALSEACGPRADECPVSYFKYCEAPNDYARAWRQRCEYNALQSIKKSMIKKDSIVRISGILYKVVSKYSSKSFIVEDKMGKIWKANKEDLELLG